MALPPDALPANDPHGWELPAFVVDRDRLVEKLEAASRSRVALVLGPSGSGKSVLLRQWAAVHDSSAIAWLTADVPDMDAVSFGRRLVEALAAVEPDFGVDALRDLERGGEHLGPTFIADLLEEARGLPPTTVVLEDVHDLRPGVVEDLDHLVRHLPAHVHLVIASRAEPAIGLARLRAHGQLAEVRPDDLAFTMAEAAQVVDHVAGRHLTRPQLDQLHRQTEGWVVGVHLAALSLRDRVTPGADGYPHNFSGTDREVADYLTEEVVRRQPRHVQDFLLTTSVLDRFDAELCDQLTGDRDGQQMLAELERRNLFVVPLDGRRGWYRYHQLFRDLLRHQLRSEDRTRHDALLVRAADVHLQRHELAAGIECLMRAQRWAEALDHISVHAWALYEAGEAARVIRWLEAVPPAERWGHPEATGTLALLHRLVGNAVATDRLLDEMERRTPADSKLRMAANAVRSAGLTAGTPPEKVLAAAHAALAWIDAQPPQDGLRPGEYPYAWIAVATRLHVGRALITLGRTDEGRAWVDRACDDSMPFPSWQIRALGLRARLDAYEGALEAAYANARHSLNVADQVRSYDTTIIGDAYLALGRIAYERDELAEARDMLVEAGTRGRVSRQPLMVAVAVVGQARVALAQGAARDGLELIARWRRQGNPPLPPLVEAALIAQEAQILLAMGEVSRAKRTLARTTPTRETLAVAAQIAAAEDDLATLELVLSQWPASTNTLPRIQHLCWSALLAHRAGDVEGAADQLRAAAERAEPDGHRRVFPDLGEVIATLITQVASRRVDRRLTALAELVAADHRAPAASNHIQLSRREVEIVTLLGTLASNDEIASQLGISTNTLKTHLKRTYRKLGVTTRRGAFQRAEELGLLGRRHRSTP